MLTPKQQALYRKMWFKVRMANNWFEVRGRLQIDHTRLNDYGRQVATAAEPFAISAHRAIREADLFHGTHMVAFGECLRREQLHTVTFSRLLALYDLLIDEANLDAVLSWQNPETVERRAIEARLLGLVTQAYIVHYAQDKHGTQYWRDLALPSLRVLCRDICDRCAARTGVSNGIPGRVAGREKSASSIPSPGGDGQGEGEPSHQLSLL